MKVRTLFEAGMETGEGPLWDHRTQQLYCVDSTNPAIWVFDEDGHPKDRMALPEQIGFVALTPDVDVLIAGLQTGVFLIRPTDRSLTFLFDPEPNLPGNRINDGVVDIDGALVFGSLDNEIRSPSGQAWRVSPQGQLSKFDDGFIVSNGPCALSDGKRFLVADSEDFQIRQYHRDSKSGFVRDGLFCDWQRAWGIPDGMVCDDQGGVWVAHWGGGCVSRFDPAGRLTHRVEVPAHQVTKPAFGGENLETLYLTSANRDMDRAGDPLGGSLFAVKTGFKGLQSKICEIDFSSHQLDERADAAD